VFDLDTLLAVPFGEAYLAALAVMILVWPVMVWISRRMHRGLNEIAGGHGTKPEGDTLVRSAAISGLIVTLLLAIDITVLLYLHNISHLSLVIPQ
jgi:hypothetical protein